MIPRPPRSTRTDTRFPYTTRFRSVGDRRLGAGIELVIASQPCRWIVDRTAIGEARLRNGRRGNGGNQKHGDGETAIGVHARALVWIWSQPRIVPQDGYRLRSKRKLQPPPFTVQSTLGDQLTVSDLGPEEIGSATGRERGSKDAENKMV